MRDGSHGNIQIVLALGTVRKYQCNIELFLTVNVLGKSASVGGVFLNRTCTYNGSSVRLVPPRVVWADHSCVTKNGGCFCLSSRGPVGSDKYQAIGLCYLCNPLHVTHIQISLALLHNTVQNLSKSIGRKKEDHSLPLCIMDICFPPQMQSSSQCVRI